MDRSPPHRRRWRGRAGATALSAGLHAALIAVLLLGWRTAAPLALQTDIPVSLAPAPLPPAPKPPGPPAPAKPAAAQAAPAKQPAPQPTPTPPAPILARRSPARPAPESPPAAPTHRPNLDQLVDAQVAEAEARGRGAGLGAGAGQGDGSGQGGGQGGGGGGACDMAGRVQAALRKDPLARAALHAASGRSIVIWDGDWVQSGAEDGKGLAAVREAITFEVAFAPPACRRQRVRGPVLLTLNDGSPQMQVGAGEWRWSDLLGLR